MANKRLYVFMAVGVLLLNLFVPIILYIVDGKSVGVDFPLYLYLVFPLIGLVAAALLLSLSRKRGVDGDVVKVVESSIEYEQYGGSSSDKSYIWGMLVVTAAVVIIGVLVVSFVFLADNIWSGVNDRNIKVDNFSRIAVTASNESEAPLLGTSYTGFSRLRPLTSLGGLD